MDITSESSILSLGQGTTGQEEALCGTGEVSGEREGGETGEKYGAGDDSEEVCLAGDTHEGGDEYVMTVSREDFEKLNNAMRMIQELESNLPPALTAWSNIKLKHPPIND